LVPHPPSGVGRPHTNNLEARMAGRQLSAAAGHEIPKADYAGAGTRRRRRFDTATVLAAAADPAGRIYMRSDQHHVNSETADCGSRVSGIGRDVVRSESV
jgi:hypothetical protein